MMQTAPFSFYSEILPEFQMLFLKIKSMSLYTSSPLPGYSGSDPANIFHPSEQLMISFSYFLRLDF